MDLRRKLGKCSNLASCLLLSALILFIFARYTYIIALHITDMFIHNLKDMPVYLCSCNIIVNFLDCRRSYYSTWRTLVPLGNQEARIVPGGPRVYQGTYQGGQSDNLLKNSVIPYLNITLKR